MPPPASSLPFETKCQRLPEREKGKLVEERVGRDLLDRGDDGLLRCFWSGATPEYRDYHDLEWGRPVTDDRRLFEKLCLEGFQSGLSWWTILRKRENFRVAFNNFDFQQVADYSQCDVERLLADAGIVRHRGKIESTINNAQRARELVTSGQTLRELIWRYRPQPKSRPRAVTKAWLATAATSPESTALSRELKRLGWRFVGPTTMYALMQAMGLVNDHQSQCHVRDDVEREQRATEAGGPDVRPGH